MHGWYGGWGWLAWLSMSLVMVAFWGLVIWAAVALFRSDQRDRPTGRPRPEDVLAQRFSAGEIDADEYHSRLDALRSTKVGVR